MSRDHPPDDRAHLGTAGTSARREHERRRAGRERRVREKHPLISGALLALGGRPRHEAVWLRGAEGEEQVAGSLAKHLGDGVIVLHDRRIPGGRGNIDHIAVAATGIWVIDSKRYRGKISVSTPVFGKAKLTIGGRDQTKLVEGLTKQVALVETAMHGVARDVPVHGALCFVDAALPLLRDLTFRGHLLLHPKRLAKRLNGAGPLSAERVRRLAAALAQRFPPA